MPAQVSADLVHEVRIMQKIHNDPALKSLRKELRSSLTPAEAALWKSLQRSQVGGKKFRRQHSVGPFILDFYCPECRLAVELDGQTHFNPHSWEHDCRRTEYLQKWNIRVVRFENRDVFEYPEWVRAEISRYLIARVRVRLATSPEICCR